MNRTELERISLRLMALHDCHTAVLYGSWARGEAAAGSDVDLLLIRQDGPDFRDARLLDGVYVDAFIYSEPTLATPKPELLRAVGGDVLREERGFGTALLANIQSLYDQGPEPMREDERQAVLLWSGKMLDRFRGQHGVEARYRRMQLFTQSLEDYFALRRLWFLGPKSALAWLREHDAAAHEQFARAAQPGASDADFAALVRAVYEPFQAGGERRALPSSLR